MLIAVTIILYIIGTDNEGMTALHLKGDSIISAFVFEINEFLYFDSVVYSYTG